MARVQVLSPAQRAKKLAATKAWQAANPEKVREIRARTYRKNLLENRRKSRQRMRALVAADPQAAAEKARRRNLDRYGLTPEAYTALAAAQGGKCASCRLPPEPGKGRGRGKLFVDHNHETGAVRALLCDPCNRTVGHAKEDADRLEACAAYLRGLQCTPL